MNSQTGRLILSVSNSKQILAMLQSRADGDDELFYSIALQVAASEARQGRRTTAEDIRAAVEEARSQLKSDGAVPIAFSAPRGDLEGLLSLRRPNVRMSDVVMDEDLREDLKDLIRQQVKRDWLHQHGKSPNRKVLFVGPPGSGKTMTSEALADALKLPLFVIRLETLITRFMGETASKLRLVFDEIGRHRGVYLFDEFDAVGSERAATNDVAEMRRVLNSFLQFMEEPTSTDSLIVGATNYPELLDKALLRRFDLVLSFNPPSADQVRAIIKSNVRPMKIPNLSWKKISAAAEGLSQSEIARATEDAVKTAILDERNKLTSQDIIERLADRQAMRKAFDPPRG